jgi:hypothetical protein
MNRRRILALALAGASGLPADAGASPLDAQIQAARELFQDAEKDEDAGRWADAFAKLKRVAEVKPTAGVRYHLALCEEHLGQIATALGDYTTAEGQARAEGAQDVLRLVGKQISALSPRVPRLTLHLVPDAPDSKVWLDGVAVARALLDVAMPVDPGVHRIEAEAPGRPRTGATVTLQEHDSTVLDVTLSTPVTPARALAPAPLVAAVPRTVSGPDGGGDGSPSRLAAVVTTSGSVALAAGGVAAFVVAGSAQANGQRQCASVARPDPNACDSERTTVRIWDFTAAGAWIAAAALGTLSVVLWTSRGTTAGPSALFVGPGMLAVKGEF